MKEQLISFDTAKLAKEKGFDLKCLGNYHIGRISGKNHVSAIQMYEKDFNNYREPHSCGYEGKKKDRGQLTTSAPTQSLLQKYLRSKHGIYAYLDYANQEVVVIDYKNHEGLELIRLDFCDFIPDYDNDDEILDKLLFEALKLIK